MGSRTLHPERFVCRRFGSKVQEIEFLYEKSLQKRFRVAPIQASLQESLDVPWRFGALLCGIVGTLLHALSGSPAGNHFKGDSVCRSTSAYCCTSSHSSRKGTLVLIIESPTYG